MALKDAKSNSKTCFKKNIFLYFEPICADLALKFAISSFEVLKRPPTNYF
jgi:hypothetical protein